MCDSFCTAFLWGLEGWRAPLTLDHEGHLVVLLAMLDSVLQGMSVSYCHLLDRSSCFGLQRNAVCDILPAKLTSRC